MTRQVIRVSGKDMQLTDMAFEALKHTIENDWRKHSLTSTGGAIQFSNARSRIRQMMTEHK